MDHVIVIEPASKIRKIARDKLSNKWVTVFLAFLIYTVLNSLIGSLLDLVFYAPNPMYTAEYEGIMSETITYGSSIYTLFVGGPLSLGLCYYLLTFFRRGEDNKSLLFEGFSHFGKAFLLALIVSIFTFLWALLFVIPGIIALLRYSQAFFLLADHPDWSPMQCIRESKRLMDGNTWKLFCLALSFIGWAFLAAIPSSFNLGLTGLPYVIVDFVLSIPLVLVTTYIFVSETALYELLTGNLVVVHDYDQQNIYSEADYRRENTNPNNFVIDEDTASVEPADNSNVTSFDFTQKKSSEDKIKEQEENPRFFDDDK